MDKLAKANIDKTLAGIEAKRVKNLEAARVRKEKAQKVAQDFESYVESVVIPAMEEA